MKISIITACYNSVETIRDAIESVRRQKLEVRGQGLGVSIEYIVVDGGSTDGTVDIIKAIERELTSPTPYSLLPTPFSFRWISEKDRGLYDALNKGIKMTTGDVIGICNADDVLAEDDTIVKVAAAFRESEDVRTSPSSFASASPDAVYADVRFVKEGEGVEALRAAKTVRYCTGQFFRNWQFRFATFPAHPSTFIRRECFEKYGLYSLDYHICADFELILRFFYRNRIRARYLPICTHVMRMGGVSTDGLKANIQINREDLRALKANGVWSCLPLIYLKYFAKVWGFVKVWCGCVDKALLQ